MPADVGVDEAPFEIGDRVNVYDAADNFVCRGTVTSDRWADRQWWFDVETEFGERYADVSETALQGVRDAR